MIIIIFFGPFLWLDWNESQLVYPGFSYWLFLNWLLLLFPRVPLAAFIMSLGHDWLLVKMIACAVSWTESDERIGWIWLDCLWCCDDSFIVVGAHLYVTDHSMMVSVYSFPYHNEPTPPRGRFFSLAPILFFQRTEHLIGPASKVSSVLQLVNERL